MSKFISVFLFVCNYHQNCIEILTAINILHHAAVDSPLRSIGHI